MMPLYEGISLIQEKQAVILDLGYAYTKFGFSGEPAPRCIIKSEFWCPTERRFKKVFDYKTPEELYENMVHMLHLLYFRHVLVNPKERRMVVVESLLTPTLVRETLAKVLYLHYEVSGVVWADSARMCAMTLAVPVALIVDVGEREIEVTAVVHGSPIIPAIQSQPIGAQALHQELARILDEDNSTELNLPVHVLEDIKVKTCFVADRVRAQQWETKSPPKPAPSVQYPRGGGVAVSGRARERAAEIMFVRDNEMSSLPDIVLQCVSMCPIDARSPLMGNILLTGGGSNLPGLNARLAEELKYLTSQPPYNRLGWCAARFHVGGALPCGAAWAGASAAGLGGARALPRDRYVAVRALPDWPAR